MPTVNLVPLSLGELLDQTFSTFRKNFWLFAGIMVLPEAVIIGLAIITQVYLHAAMPLNPGHSPQAAAESAKFFMRAGVLSLASLIPHYVVYAMALGATTFALSEVYLGRATTIRSSYRVVASKLWRIIKVIFAILFRSFGILILAFVLFVVMMSGIALLPRSVVWVGLLVGLLGFAGMILAGILAIIFLVRYSVAVPALLLEKLSTRQALKRSVALTRGFLWRLLVVAVVMTLISVTIVSLCQMPFSVVAFLVSMKGGQPSLWLTVPSLLLGGLGGVATAPLLMISFAIAYYDLRVRKEGFDLQLMMAQFDAARATAGSGPEPAAEIEPLEDAGVFGMCLWTLFTAGLYLPTWLLSRRKALNQLHSQEKLAWWPAAAALLAIAAGICLPIVGSIKWGSWVEAENALGPVHPIILLIAATLLVVQSFQVRRILVNHLAPQEEGMFAASIRFQYDELFSKVCTFVFGIIYLQYKINSLLDRFKAEDSSQARLQTPAPQPMPAPPVAM